MQTNMKYLIIISILFLTACSNDVNLGTVSDDDNIKIEKELIRIEKEQEKLEDGKYKYKPKYEKEGITYETSVYGLPDGGIGYQTYIESSDFLISTGTMPDLSYYIDKTISTSTL